MKTSCGKFLNLAHYFPYDVNLRLLAHSRSFLANQKARNAIVEAENLLIPISLYCADVIIILTIRPVARKGCGSIAHEAKPNGLLTSGP